MPLKKDCFINGFVFHIKMPMPRMDMHTPHELLFHAAAMMFVRTHVKSSEATRLFKRE